MTVQEKIKLFLASPGDTKADREAVVELVGEWNSEEARRRIELYYYEDLEGGATAGAGNPQERINDKDLHDSDIMVCIFWNRFFSNSAKTLSNTYTELSHFISNKKPFVVYFVDRSPEQSAVSSLGEDIGQITRLKQRLQSGDNEQTTRDITDLRNAKEKFFLELEELISLHDGGGRALDIALPPPHKLYLLKQHWFETSISEEIEKALYNDGLKGLQYQKDLTFSENVELWKVDFPQLGDASHRFENAREHAFNVKYGDFNYDDDLRSMFPNWFEPLKTKLRELALSIPNPKMLAVAANMGDEIAQLLPDSQNWKVTVLDFSSTAIEKGKQKHKHFEFVKGNMERPNIFDADFDVYLNLRSIHSRGVEMKSTLAHARRVLKKDGLCIISVSNGYIWEEDGQKTIAEGMYDSRTKTFSIVRPDELVIKIKDKMRAYGFQNVRYESHETEVFIFGKKG